MGTRIATWLEERWPLKSVTNILIDEDIPGGASFFYSIGSGVLFVFILQAFTGLFQLFFYVPTIDHAYNSVSYLRTEVPFGWLVHGLHYWGAQAMIVLVVLHMSRVFVWGAFKKPRELTWIAGTVLLLLTLGMSFTGAALPWDVKGYWATEVGTSMAGTVPLVGNFIKTAIRGGQAMGQLALTRFFVIHIAVLPGILALVLIIHLVAFRRSDPVGPWRESRRASTGPFWPDQLFKDTVFASLILLILIALTVWAVPSFSGPADPTDLTVQPKPEWNFLFLYQAIKIFKGPLEPVGTAALPLLAGLFLILVPFLSKKSERHPARRLLGMAVFLGALAGVVTLTIAGAMSRPGQASAKVAATPGAKGMALFQSSGCSGCHMINGAGGRVGPDLSDESGRNRSREWLVEQIRDPRSHNPQTAMPSFSTRLSRVEIATLVDYLMKLRGQGSSAEKAAGPGPSSASQAPPAAPGAVPVASQPQSREPGPAADMLGNADHGSIVFRERCQGCHGPEGQDKVPNPGSEDGTVPPLNPIDREFFNPDPQVFAANIDRFIQHGSVPEGPSPVYKMPAWGDSGTLTQQAIANVEAYVLSLNGVDRTKIMVPGPPPRLFLLLSAIVIGAAVLALGLAGLSRRKRQN